jgi:protein Mpv17
MCAFNGMMGCLGHFYYGALDRGVLQHAPKSARSVVAKVAVDQLLFAPVCTAAFYAYKCAAEGRPT